MKKFEHEFLGEQEIQLFNKVLETIQKEFGYVKEVFHNQHGEYAKFKGIEFSSFGLSSGCDCIGLRTILDKVQVIAELESEIFSELVSDLSLSDLIEILRKIELNLFTFKLK